MPRDCSFRPRCDSTRPSPTRAAISTSSGGGEKAVDAVSGRALSTGICRSSPRKAKWIATQAKPITGLTLSLCMIVRDEEEMLGRCLAAVAPAVDEIVIVDTGSCDRTIEIAESFGAKVIEREWTGSFSDARNASFEAATGDWIMYLDADEVLVSDDVDELRSLTTHTWREAFYLVETNYTGGAGDGTAVVFNALRMFRNRPHYRFEGRLHEQIAQHLPMYLPERIELSSVRVEHYGYLGSVRDAKEKSQRNITLLKAQQAENDSSPFLHFNLGSEYAAAGDAFAAAGEFERAWQMIRTDPNGTKYGFASPLAVRLVRAQRESGRPGDAIAQAAECLLAFPRLTDLVLEQAIAYVASNREQQAVEHFQKCVEMGDAPSRYTSTVGSGTYLPRLALAELHLQRGELAHARELLDWCLTEYPDFFGNVLPYATVLVRSGLGPAEVVAEVERRVSKPTPTIHFMLGIALHEAGLSETAEQQFRLVLEAQPHSSQARVALGESLLAQRRYIEAAAEAGQVPEEDPLAAAACRTELFGLLASDDREGASVAYARAARAGLTDVELAVFAGWSALATGKDYPSRIPRAGASLLEVILEALLKVQEFKAFETLVPLLARTELSRRDQREVLASMYLRRGFLTSAAKEWMDVCAERPDAQALAGLAQAALVHGLPEDAVTFATEALALEPGNRTAGAIIAAHRSAEAA